MTHVVQIWTIPLKHQIYNPTQSKSCVTGGKNSCFCLMDLGDFKVHNKHMLPLFFNRYSCPMFQPMLPISLRQLLKQFQSVSFLLSLKIIKISLKAGDECYIFAKKNNTSKTYHYGEWTSKSLSSAPLPVAAAQSHRAAQHPHNCHIHCTVSHAVFLLHSAPVERPTPASLHLNCRSLCLAGGRAASGHC